MPSSNYSVKEMIGLNYWPAGVMTDQGTGAKNRSRGLNYSSSFSTCTSVLIGTFLDRIRLYVAAYSVDGIGNPAIDKHALDLDKLPDAVMPGMPDYFIMVGVIGGTLLLYLFASRLIPILNIWEQRELLMYKIHKTFHRTEVMVLGKPD